MSLKLSYKDGNFARPFQRAILGVYLRSTTALKRYRSVVDPRYFETEVDQEICQAMLTVFDKAKAPPSLASLQHVLKSQVRDKGVLKESLEKAASYCKRNVKDEEFILSQAIDFARTQALANAAVTTAHDIAKPGHVRQQAMNQIVTRFQQAIRVGEDMSDLGLNFMKRLPRQLKLRKRGKLKPKGIPTGFPHLDYILHGGAQKGWFIFVTGLGKCVSPDSRVWTPTKGWVRMGDIAAGKQKVYGVDVETRRPKLTNVTDVFHQGKKLVANIKLRSGRVIRGFADTHPVLTWDGWKTVEELKKGDFVIGSRVLPLSGRSENTDRTDAYVCGVFTGDGGLTRALPTLTCHVEDDVEVFEAVRDLLPCDCYSSSAPKKGTLGVTHYFKTSTWAWLDSRGMTRHKSKNKSVPPWIYAKGAETCAAFLAGLFDADGSAYRTRRGAVRCEITTASYELSEHILTMLNCLGIYAKRRKRTMRLADKIHYAWTVDMNDEEGVALFESRVGVYGRHVKKWGRIRGRFVSPRPKSQFYTRLPYHVWQIPLDRLGGRTLRQEKTFAGMWRTFNSTNSKMASTRIKASVFDKTRIEVHQAEAIAKYLGDDSLLKWATGDFVFDEVEAVDWAGQSEVIDISTEDSTQSFLSESVFTHNSGKSRTLLNFGLGATSAGYRVLYLTLELASNEKDDDIGERLQLRIAGPRKCELAYTDPDAFCKVVASKAPLYMQGDFISKQYPAKTLTGAKVKTLLQAFRANGEPVDVLIIDHADLMAPDDIGKNASRTEKEGQVFLDIKNVTQEEDVLCYSATQAKGSSRGKEEGDAGDVGWSSDKINHCDLALMLNQTRAEAKEKRGRLSVIASRRHIGDVHIDVRIEPQAFFMESVGLYDAYMDRIATPYDSDKDDGSDRKRLAVKLKTGIVEKQKKDREKKFGKDKRKFPRAA